MRGKPAPMPYNANQLSLSKHWQSQPPNRLTLGAFGRSSRTENGQYRSESASVLWGADPMCLCIHLPFIGLQFAVREVYATWERQSLPAPRVRLHSISPAGTPHGSSKADCPQRHALTSGASASVRLLTIRLGMVLPQNGQRPRMGSNRAASPCSPRPTLGAMRTRRGPLRGCVNIAQTQRRGSGGQSGPIAKRLSKGTGCESMDGF